MKKTRVNARRRLVRHSRLLEGHRAPQDASLAPEQGLPHRPRHDARRQQPDR